MRQRYAKHAIRISCQDAGTLSDSVEINVACDRQLTSESGVFVVSDLLVPSVSSRRSGSTNTTRRQVRQIETEAKSESELKPKTETETETLYI